MTVRRLQAALAFACATLTAACGSGGDGGSTGPIFSDSLSTTEASGFSSDALGIAGRIATGINREGPSIGISAPAFARRAFGRGSLAALPSAVRSLAEAIPTFGWRTAGVAAGFRASGAEGCTVTAHGTDSGLDGYVDLNGNGIPDDWYIKQDCIVTDSTGDTTRVEHSVVVQQAKENGAALYGFDYQVSYRATVTDQFGNTLVGVSYDGAEQVDLRSGLATHRVTVGFRGWHEIDGILHEGTAGESFDGTFDPLGTITLGAAVGNGSLTFTGREFYTETDGRNLSFTIGTTAPLAYSALCYGENTLPPFSAGVIAGQLNNNASQAGFTITFNACNGYGVNYHGTVG